MSCPYERCDFGRFGMWATHVSPLQQVEFWSWVRIWAYCHAPLQFFSVISGMYLYGRSTLRPYGSFHLFGRDPFCVMPLSFAFTENCELTTENFTRIIVFAAGWR